MSDLVKVTYVGNRTTVELPKAYWFDTDKVFVRREGSRIILEPVKEPASSKIGLTIA